MLCAFKRTVLAKNNKQNLILLKLNLEDKHDIKRIKTIDKNKRWVEFRKHKNVVIDAYIAQRKKQAISETYLKYLFLRQILGVCSDKFAQAFLRYERKMRGKWMYGVIAKHWIRRRKRFAPNLEEVVRRTFKKRMTLLGLVEHETTR